MQTLNIAGIHRSSLIDFPKKVACVIFTQGCNLRCPWCHNGRLVPERLESPSPDFDPDKCLDFIKSRAKLIDGVVISGGEPLLQPNLPDFISEIKKFGLSVKLDTNGTFPSRLEPLLANGLVDYVSIDIKAPLTSVGAYSVAAGGCFDTSSIQKSVTILEASGVSGEFRTTILPGFHTFEMLVELVEGLPPHLPYYLQLFIPTHARSGYWSRTPRESGVSIRDLAERLRARFPERQIHARA